MKKTLFFLFALWLNSMAFAYEIEHEGLYYNVIATTDDTHKDVEVTYPEGYYYSGYSGDIVIPSSFMKEGVHYTVTSIGQEAFDNGLSLTSISIPSSVTWIENYAFFNCHNLTSINVDADNPIYDSRDNCNALIHTESGKLIAGCKNTTIPSGVTAIGPHAFINCSGLTSIDIPNGVTCIESEAFKYCNNLTSLSIPNSVANIGEGAFEYAYLLDNQEDGLIYIGRTVLYKGSMPEDMDITIKEGTKGIASSAFSGCTGLTSIIIPNSVESIGSDAFYGCN